MDEVLSKGDALAQVTADTLAYYVSQDAVGQARATLFESIRVARKARATQQQIADATVIDPDKDDGLSRQRIAQILAGA